MSGTGVRPRNTDEPEGPPVPGAGDCPLVDLDPAERRLRADLLSSPFGAVTGGYR
jgi:hypothetical protein